MRLDLYHFKLFWLTSCESCYWNGFLWGPEEFRLPDQTLHEWTLGPWIEKDCSYLLLWLLWIYCPNFFHNRRTVCWPLLDHASVLWSLLAWDTVSATTPPVALNSGTGCLMRLAVVEISPLLDLLRHSYDVLYSGNTLVSSGRLLMHDRFEAFCNFKCSLHSLFKGVELLQSSFQWMHTAWMEIRHLSCSLLQMLTLTHVPLPWFSDLLAFRFWSTVVVIPLLSQSLFFFF